MRSTALLFWLFGVGLHLCASITHAADNFVPVRLPKGVTVELPKNWTVLTNNQRIRLESWVQAQTEFVDATSVLGFGANYYDEQGKTGGIFNIRYYPDLDVTQLDANAANTSDIKALNDLLRQGIVQSIGISGSRLLNWVGTTKRSINGTTVFITEYRRTSQIGSNFRVRLIRIFNGRKSFTITISYREDLDFFLRPISDRIIASIRI